jgi:hypothetical protein
MPFDPTDEQFAVVEAGRGKQSLMITAYAGCAKTTTLELVGKVIKAPALALAFNVSIKKELERRFEPNFQVKTLNGLGYGAMMRAMPNVTFQSPDGRKIGKLVTHTAKSQKIELISESWDTTKNLVQRAMNAGLVPRDEGRPLVGDNDRTWQGLMEDENILPDDMNFFHSLAYQVLEKANELTRQGIISFDDQVYYSVCVAGQFPKFPVMVVDEAQDLSPLNHAMLELAKRDDGRLIVVGDPKQAIYAFRGADSRSMARLRRLKPDGAWTDLPLTLTFRCPKIIVDRQQSHAPGFRAAGANAQGRVLKIGVEDPFDFKRSWSWDDVMREAKGARVAVLCRNNAPLIGLAFKLLRRRISVQMAGRDIGKGLVTLSKKVFPEDHIGRDEMKGLLEEWEETEVSAAASADKPETADAARDRAESLRAVIGFAEVEDAGKLRSTLKSLFDREDGQVLLSTIHRAKGLEWDAVLHLDPWRLPSKWAKEAARMGNGTGLEQEMNLKYVCETRTRELLMEADLEGFI